MEENQGKGGGGAITSEALQPIYELKHVAERSSKSNEEVLAKLSMVSNNVIVIIPSIHNYFVTTTKSIFETNASLTDISGCWVNYL